eukprot:UN04433
MSCLNTKQLRLLVCGYVREQEQLLNLSTIVPSSIIPIIYEYQFYIETWSKTCSNSAAKISEDGQYVEIEETDGHCTVYGEHIIHKGETFSWNLKFIECEPCHFLVGIIPNDADTLTKYKSDYFWYQAGGYVWCSWTGQFGYESKINQKYSETCTVNKGDTFRIKLNLNESTLHFMCNEQDFGNGLSGTDHKIKNDETTEFRFVFCAKRKSIFKIRIFDDQ